MTLEAQELQLRRGTSAEDDAFTGLAGGHKVAMLGDVPTKTSDLTNDSGYLSSLDCGIM